MIKTLPAIDASSLEFWTSHETKPCLVKLSPLRDGLSKPSKGAPPRWSGAFTGRPELIEQLLPAIKEKLQFATEETCKTFLSRMRRWWRLFDSLEKRDQSSGLAIARLIDVRQLSNLHAQAARDLGFDTNAFVAFRSVASTTRQALGLRPLHWIAPEPVAGKRHLPSQDVIAQIWVALKHGWFATLARWDRANALLAGKVKPANDAENALAASYASFARARLMIERGDGRSHPQLADLKANHGSAIPDENPAMNIAAVYAGFYPNADDARMAFHLCLSGTGWNPQTLLDLQVNASGDSAARMPFLRTHPSDQSRYVLRGFKERGKSEHTVHGDWKTDRSPGAVIREMVSRTWPLREEVIRILKEAEQELAQITCRFPKGSSVNKLRLSIEQLRQASRSAWLYCDRTGIHFLSAASYGMTGVKPRKQFLKVLVDTINSKRTGVSRIPYLVATDFRDAFASYVWHSTGGSVLHVMKALGHRWPIVTGRYLNNTSVNATSSHIFRNFTNVLWRNIAGSERLDITLVAKEARDGKITKQELERLEHYRLLKRSRTGVLCKNPHNPPPAVDPDFVANGSDLCTTHRCTLCHENAVITAESVPGLSMRLVELRWLKTNMPIESFVLGDFQLEMERTEGALGSFDAASVNEQLDAWQRRVDRGEHRILEFRGIQTRAWNTSS